MNMTKSVEHLDDRILLQRLHQLCARERQVTAQLLWHLAEVDRRGLYRDRGYSSLFNYCVKALHKSELASAAAKVPGGEDRTSVVA